MALAERRAKLNAAGTNKYAATGQVTRQTGKAVAAPETRQLDKRSNVQKSLDWAGSVGSSVASVATGAVAATAKFAANTPKYTYEGVKPFLQGVASTMLGEHSKALDNVNIQSKQLDEQMSDLVERRRSGKISNEDYSKMMKSISSSYSDLSKESQRVQTATDRGNVAESAATTAATILLGGRFKTGTGAATQTAARTGQTRVVQQLLGEGATKLEQQMLRSKGIRELVTRNLMTEGKIAASESAVSLVAREGKALAANLLIKRPLFYESIIGDSRKSLEAVLTGDYPQAIRSAAWVASNMVNGGMLGKPMEYLSKATGKARVLAYGKGSVIDALSRKIGDGNSNQIARLIQTAKQKAPKEGKELEETFRIMVERAMRVSGDNAELAAENILRTYGARDLTKLSATDIYQDMKNWRAAFDATDAAMAELVKAGKITAEEAARITPVRVDARTRDAIEETIRNAPSPEEALKAIRKMAENPAEGWANNQNFMAEIEQAIKTARSSEEAAKAVRNIDAAANIPSFIPSGLKRELAKLGYTVAEPAGGLRVGKVTVDDTRKLVTSAISPEKRTIKNPDLVGVDKALIKEAQESKTLDEFLEKQNKLDDADPLESLKQEARKYKSVEEFLESAKKKVPIVKTKNGLLDVNATLDKLPPVESGYTRYFRGDGGIFKHGEVWDESTMRVPEGAKSGDSFWLTQDLKYADYYRETYGAGAELKYIDLPEGLAKPDSRYKGLEYFVNKSDIYTQLHKSPPVQDTDKLKKIYEAAKKPTIEVFDDAFEEAIAPNPGMAAFTRFLERTGMSPSSSNQLAYKVLSENVIANIDNTTAAAIGLNAKGNVPKGGQQILYALQNYVESKKGLLGASRSAVTDIRQLRASEIMEALPGLKLNKQQAKEVLKSIKQAYLEVPLELRGAGDKIVDSLYRYNPAHGLYSRIQSAMRYSYNPFFRIQERTETKILSHASSHNLIWNKSRGELDEAAQILDDARIFSSSLYGEGAQDQVLGRITANITQGQKRDLAGLAMDIADKRGMTLRELVNNHPEDVDDALRVIVQYPRKGLLASPLARTLNFAFFPMRYNAKVTMMAAKLIAKEPPYIQKAIIHSMFRMGDWLKSEEGILWQQQHQDAIRVFNWITPINSIAYTHNLLTNVPDEASDFGMLGGLPLGVISQILDSQGIISLNNPYVDKKTGDVFPKYIPETTKARAATALTDLLGSMFTYPGRTLGLPGKGEGLRNVVKTFIATNGEDFEKRLDESQLTDLDRQWIKVLKAEQNGKADPEDIDALYNTPAPGQFNWYTLPPLALPFKTTAPEPRVKPRTGLPAKKSGRGKGKKAKKIAIPLTP